MIAKATTHLSENSHISQRLPLFFSFRVHCNSGNNSDTETDATKASRIAERSRLVCGSFANELSVESYGVSTGSTHASRRFCGSALAVRLCSCWVLSVERSQVVGRTPHTIMVADVIEMAGERKNGWRMQVLYVETPCGTMIPASRFLNSPLMCNVVVYTLDDSNLFQRTSLTNKLSFATKATTMAHLLRLLPCLSLSLNKEDLQEHTERRN